MTKLVLSVGAPVVEELKSLLNKAAVILDQKFEFKNIDRKKKAYSIRITLTGKVVLRIEDDFLLDVLKLYGNIFITGLSFGKMMTGFHEQHDQLMEKWSDKVKEPATTTEDYKPNDLSSHPFFQVFDEKKGADFFDTLK